jgi:K+-transporting ATPase KdpF subunit
MDLPHAAGVLVSVAILVYLVVALLGPEKF